MSRGASNSMQYKEDTKENTLKKAERTDRIK